MLFTGLFYFQQSLVGSNTDSTLIRSCFTLKERKLQSKRPIFRQNFDLIFPHFKKLPLTLDTAMIDQLQDS